MELPEQAYEPGGVEYVPRLIALQSLLSSREYPLDKAEIVVGRDEAACDIAIPSNAVSRRHFVLISEFGKPCRLRDLGSTNGVYINAIRIEHEVVLRDGDLIGAGADEAPIFRFQTRPGNTGLFKLQLPAKDRWTIGRSPANDIPLVHEPLVSACHACARRKGDRVIVIDQASLNGTWVNQRRVRKAVLGPTDTVRVGTTELRLRLGEDGSLLVFRRDCSDKIALEAIGLTRNVTVRHGMRTEEKAILDRISLCIRPGEFVGIIGPSGAGKTTLLKALNGFHPPDYGCVLLNDTPLYRSYDMFRNMIGYVPQDDIVHRELTVESSLNYVAKLRLPPDTSALQRRALVDKTIQMLGLGNVRTQRINQLSGGQRKRVSVGCELITRPGILFLDEPTSGMDPNAEERLMRHFQGLARGGTTVLITTHVLNNLDLLDRVVVLARGKLAFFGTPAEAMNFFTRDGRAIQKPTMMFELLENQEPITEGGSAVEDTPAVIALNYERAYRNSALFDAHITGPFSDVATDLFNTSERGQVPASTPAAANNDYYRRLLDHPVGPSKKSLRAKLKFFSARAFAILASRHFGIRFVSPKRVMSYLLVPLVLALVTLSLRTQDVMQDREVLDKKDRITAQLERDPADLAGNDNDQEKAESTAESSESQSDPDEQLDKLKKSAADLAESANKLKESTASVSSSTEDIRSSSTKLAESSEELKTSSNDIGKLAEDLRSSSQQVSGSGDKLGKATTELRTSTDALANGAAQMPSYMARFKEGVQKVAAASTQVGENVRRVVDANNRLGASSKEVAAGVAKLDNGLTEANKGAGDLAKGATELADGVGDLQKSSTDLATAAEDVSEAVNKFENVQRPGPIDLGPAVKELLLDEPDSDARSAVDVVYGLKHEGMPNLPVPLAVLLMFVMTSIFTGTLMACLELSTERPIYLRERMASQRITDYLTSKLPFLFVITGVQCALFLALCWLKPALHEVDLQSALLALLAMTWASCAMGLFLSAIDPTNGQFSVVLAIVAVLPQLVLSGGLGPDFYGGMPRPMRFLADLLPARWGLEMLFTAFYGHSDRMGLNWVGDLVVDTLGFRFGAGVIGHNLAILAMQGVGWLVLCGLAIKRMDRVRQF